MKDIENTVDKPKFPLFVEELRRTRGRIASISNGERNGCYFHSLRRNAAAILEYMRE